MVSEASSPQLYQALNMVREQGLRTVITGEANDELTCGHGEMIRIRDGYYQRWVPLRRKPALMRHLAAWLGPIVWPERREILQRAASEDSEYFWNFDIGWMPLDKRAVLTPSGWEQCQAEDSYQVVKRHAARFRASEHSRRDYLNYIVYTMMQDHYFGNLMLSKLELLSSRLGIEARCPYTEPKYAHFVYNVPAGFKTKDGLVKYFFKKSIAGLLPDSVIYRPKQGFRTPVVELFRGALGDWAEPVLMEQGLSRIGFFRREHLADLLRRHRAGEKDFSGRLWTAMAVNLWYERWVASPRRDLEAPIPLEHAADSNGTSDPKILTLR
jgi:asparagine synthase (glutamine-hydrolysing)